MRRSTPSGVIAALVVVTAALSLTAVQAVPAESASASSAPASDPNALLQRQAAAFEPAPIKWGFCGNQNWADRGLQCGTLTVPMNYANPTGKKIKLAVSRVEYSMGDRQGVMVVNLGGPGAAGVSAPLLREAMPSGAGDGYEWVALTPRGVSPSSPALTCDADYFAPGLPKFVPTDEKIEKAWLARAKGYAADCGKAGGDFLNYLKTTDNAQDLESLRKALGVSQISYYGFAYGTYLGMVYSTLFPQQIRRMVLDGPVDPSRVWYKFNLDQDVAFDKAAKQFFEWAAEYDSVYHLGPTGAAVEKKYHDTLKALYKKRKLNNKLGGTEWNLLFLHVGYGYFWPEMAQLFNGAVNQGKWQAVLDRYNAVWGGGGDNTYAVYAATTCTEGKWTKDWTVWQSDNWRIHQQAPFQTWSQAWYNAPCAFWPKRSATPVTIDGSKAPPILLIDETLDGATPFAGALKVRALFPKAVLLEGVGGAMHGSSLSGTSWCTVDARDAYVGEGVLPARVAGNTSDLKCAPLAQPDPTAPMPDGELRPVAVRWPTAPDVR